MLCFINVRFRPIFANFVTGMPQGCHLYVRRVISLISWKLRLYHTPKPLTGVTGWQAGFITFLFLSFLRCQKLILTFIPRARKKFIKLPVIPVTLPPKVEWKVKSEEWRTSYENEELKVKSIFKWGTKSEEWKIQLPLQNEKLSADAELMKHGSSLIGLQTLVSQELIFIWFIC